MNECLVVKGRMNIDEMCLWDPQKRERDTSTVINSYLSVIESFKLTEEEKN